MALGSVRKRTHTWVSGGETKTKVTWLARYRIPGTTRQPSKSFDLKKDAEQWLNEQTAGLVRGDHVDPVNAKTTLRAFAETWESIQISREGTARITDNALRLHIIPALGDMPIGSIRRSTVQSFIKALESTVTRPATEELPARLMAPGSVRNIYDVLARVMDAAAEDRVIPASPCKRITLPKDDDAEPVIPMLAEVEQVRAALAMFDGRWDVIPLVLCGTGLRIGELLGLKVSDVDFLRRTISVERQRLQKTNEIGPLKTARSKRTLAVGQVTLDALAAHLARYGAAEDGSLFADEWKRPLTYRRWKNLIQRATADAGVMLTSHSFRHFAASALISGGASVKVVQTFLGHASAVITLKTYAHLFPGDEDRTRVVLDAALTQPVDEADDDTAEGRG